MKHNFNASDIPANESKTYQNTTKVYQFDKTPFGHLLKPFLRPPWLKSIFLLCLCHPPCYRPAVCQGAKGPGFFSLCLPADLPCPSTLTWRSLTLGLRWLLSPAHLDGCCRTAPIPLGPRPCPLAATAPPPRLPQGAGPPACTPTPWPVTNMSESIQPRGRSLEISLSCISDRGHPGRIPEDCKAISKGSEILSERWRFGLATQTFLLLPRARRAGKGLCLQ